MAGGWWRTGQLTVAHEQPNLGLRLPGDGPPELLGPPRGPHEVVEHGHLGDQQQLGVDTLVAGDGVGEDLLLDPGAEEVVARGPGQALELRQELLGPGQERLGLLHAGPRSMARGQRPMANG